MVKLVKEKLQNSSIEQYKNEERAALAKRIFSAETRIQKITCELWVMILIAPEDKSGTIKIRIVSLY